VSSNVQTLGIIHIIFWGIFLFWGDSISAQDEDIFQFPEPEIEELSPDMMLNESQIIYIQDLWKFRVGDSLEWANPAYDDSGWDYLSTNLSQADLSFMDLESNSEYTQTLEGYLLL